MQGPQSQSYWKWGPKPGQGTGLLMAPRREAGGAELAGGWAGEGEGLLPEPLRAVGTRSFCILIKLLLLFPPPPRCGSPGLLARPWNPSIPALWPAYTAPNPALPPCSSRQSGMGPPPLTLHPGPPRRLGKESGGLQGWRRLLPDSKIAEDSPTPFPLLQSGEKVELTGMRQQKGLPSLFWKVMCPRMALEFWHPPFPAPTRPFPAGES